MEELLNALENTLDVVQINIQEPGCDITIHSKIVDYTKFEDGITLYLEGENELFISSLINKMESSGSDDDYHIGSDSRKAKIIS